MHAKSLIAALVCCLTVTACATARTVTPAASPESANPLAGPEWQGNAISYSGYREGQSIGRTNCETG